MEQRVSGPRLKMWQGCVAVVLAAVFLFAAQFVLTFLQYTLTYFRILERAGSPIPSPRWPTGCWAAFWGLKFLRDYVLNYLYTANTKQLRVERVYGPGRPRFVEDVYFSRLKALGELEEMKKRFPGAKVLRATLRRATLPVKAMAYDSTEGMKILLIQPSEEMWAICRPC